MLSQRSHTPSAEHNEVALKKSNKTSFFADDTKSQAMTAKIDLSPQKEGSTSPALKKQSTFISMLQDNASPELRRQKTKGTSFFEALIPKYKHLSKFAQDDYGTFNLVKIIEQQVLYGEGVRTLRIVNGVIEEVAEENYSQLLVREIETPEIGMSEGRRNVAKHKEEEYRILKSRLKTKKDLRKLIDETPYPLSLTIIKAFTLVCIVLLTVLLVGEYLYTRYRLQGILEATNMLEYTFHAKEGLLNLWYNARELFLVYSGYYSIYKDTYPYTNSYISQLQAFMNSESFTTHSYVNSLTSYPTNIHNNVSEFMYTPLVYMYLYTPNSNEFSTKNYTIYQAIQIVFFRNL